MVMAILAALFMLAVSLNFGDCFIVLVISMRMIHCTDTVCQILMQVSESRGVP